MALKSMGQTTLPPSDSFVVSIPMRSFPDPQPPKLPTDDHPAASFSAELGLTVGQVDDSTLAMINQFPLADNSFLSDSLFPSFQGYPKAIQNLETLSQMEHVRSLPEETARLSGDLGVFPSYFGNDILDISQLSLSRSLATTGNDGWCVSWEEKEPLPLSLPLSCSPISLEEDMGCMGVPDPIGPDPMGPMGPMGPVGSINSMGPMSPMSPVGSVGSMAMMSPIGSVGPLGVMDPIVAANMSNSGDFNTLLSRDRVARRQRLLEEVEKEEVEFVQSGQVIDITQTSPTVIMESAVTGLDPVSSDSDDCVTIYQGGKKLDVYHFEPETMIPQRMSMKRPEETMWKGGVKFSLEESELKKLCSKFYSLNPPASVMEDSDRFKRCELSQPPLVLPTELEFIRNNQESGETMMLSAAGRSRESELGVGVSMTDIISTVKERIKEYLSTVMHTLFDECDYYYPEISDIPFLNFFSNKLKLCVCSESCRMLRRGCRRRSSLFLWIFEYSLSRRISKENVGILLNLLNKESLIEIISEKYLPSICII